MVQWINSWCAVHLCPALGDFAHDPRYQAVLQVDICSIQIVSLPNPAAAQGGAKVQEAFYIFQVCLGRHLCVGAPNPASSAACKQSSLIC